MKSTRLLLRQGPRFDALRMRCGDLGLGLLWLAAMTAGTTACYAADTLKTGPAASDIPAPAVTIEREEAVKLDRVDVRVDRDGSDFDATGMGSHEKQLLDWPFTNDLVTMEPVDDPVIATQLQQVANPSPVDLATGEARINLRGFPTPILRNGFVTMGANDMLNTGRTVVIQGALVPVMGRAAPGGIQDFWTARPRTKPGRRYDYSISSLHNQSAGTEIVGITAPKKAWHRMAFNWNRRTGPEQFSASETRTAHGAVTWRHSAKASTLWAVDYQQVRATASQGVPEYRMAPGEKIVGPYRPLAAFNAFGPEAGVRRRTGAFTAWLDGQPHPQLIVRAGLEAWWRTVEQDRFTTGLFNVATQRFEGTREPRHSEQPQSAYLAHLEITARFKIRRTEHKLMASASHTWGTYRREEYALPTTLRNQLPESVRFFFPSAPNYYRPAFSEDVYSRVLNDRQERARYAAIELTERIGVADGRYVFATGLRQDFVGLNVMDRRPGAAMPRVRDNVGQLTYHFGVNYQAVPSRLLLFTTASTAFEPSTRVDSRTGRIQGNDTTRGYEVGLKGRSAKGAIEASASAFLLYNQDISRRNPLYDDPIFDANQTQPQLVAAGEERFSGGKLEARWKPSIPWTLSARGAYTRAITTKSPDLPQEVGRPITRLPPYTASASAGYSFSKGKAKGLTLGGSWSYVSRYVAAYEDRQRYGLEYPGYGLVSLNGNWSITRKTVSHNIGLSVRNAGNLDLLRSQARVGAGREFVGSYRISY